MAGEIISAVAQATSQSSWVDAPVLRAGSESDAGRLADLLSAQPAASAPNPVVEPVSQISGPGLGDSILRSMDAVGKAYSDKASDVHRFLSVPGGEFSTLDLIKLQFQMIDTSLQVDLISKTVSKANQHIDQLTKLQ
jgi:type III secretion system YscI/HrpB-like protein